MNRKARHASVILLAMPASVLVMMLAPTIAFAQFGLFPFNPTPEVLPTYISRIVPGAAFEDSLFHYYPEDIAVPAGTTIAWFNDDPGQPHTVTSGSPNSEDSNRAFHSGVIPYTSFFQYTFDEAGTYEYYCTLHPWRTGMVTVSEAVEFGHNFEFRSGTGPTLNLTQHNSTVLNFKPTTITPQETTPITYNATLLSPDGAQVFSESFFVLDSDLQVELINDPTMNGTAAYGPDFSDPITGTYHVSGNLFETAGDYVVRVEIVAIGNEMPAQGIADEFHIQVSGIQ